MSKSTKSSSRAKMKQDTAEQIEEALGENFAPENPLKRKIKVKQFPWTKKQKEFFRVALHPSTKIVFVNGPAGTSKTLLSVYCGLQLLNMKVISDIMYLRSAVESSEAKLGFLPGSAEDKLRFYNLPFLDKLDELLAETRAEKLEEQGRISMFPVNFARGMNWKGKCVILDEAQNSTSKEIITVLTRLGEGSRAFVCADPMQTDIRNHGGFEHLCKGFFGKDEDETINHGIYYFQFEEEDIMRSELVKFIVSRYRDMMNEDN